jgi:hypothetical protein
VECPSESWLSDQKIPLAIEVDNRRCKEKVTQVTVKLVRNLKFRIDLGTGQEVTCRSLIATSDKIKNLDGYSKTLTHIELKPENGLPIRQ